MRYKKLTAIILKKQNYKEADQIVTAFTEEAGKVRFLAKSIRHSKSKLVYHLSDLTLAEIEITGRNLPIVISAHGHKTFLGIKEDLTKTALSLYCTELILKLTADEQSNPAAFGLLLDFFNQLETSIDPARYYHLLGVFSLNLLATLGFNIEYASSSFSIPEPIREELKKVNSVSLKDIHRVDFSQALASPLHQTINRFVEFVLERNLKSEAFLASVRQ